MFINAKMQRASPIKFRYFCLKLVVLFTMLLPACSATDSPVHPEYIFIPESKSIEIEVLTLINEYRSNIDLSALDTLAGIKAVAYTHTDYMIRNNTPSHDYFFNRKAYLKEELGALKVGENVGYGFGTATGLVNAWLESTSHKEVIEGDYTHFDIAAEQDANGRWYFTNIFIKM